MLRPVCLIALGLSFLADATGTEFTPAQAELYNKLTHELIAPCCWREPIAIHRSDPMPERPEDIVMLIYPGMTALDLIGPQQVFGYVGRQCAFGC